MVLFEDNFKINVSLLYLVNPAEATMQTCDGLI
jgi:hypothetical protein